MNTSSKAPITIVEYEPRYAASLAEMWNVSSDSWGGDAYVHTEQDILEKSKHSTDLQTFLALDGDLVVGFCSFSYYKEDEGAMYIPLLNVRPDYHGQKVGKMLVLNAVRRTIELGYPRLDLYTWPGNIKAVPAYKKSGFFWEKREDTTHLMNFIPSVLATEAVSDFFDVADWYTDGKRDLSVYPDGGGENGFDFFTYDWEKEGRSLTMQFERTGRGLRKIENDDYRIETIIERHTLPFGRSYPVTYRITNKSGAPLDVTIEGQPGKGIQFDLNQQISLSTAGSSQDVTGSFELLEQAEEPSVWRTHPGVEAKLSINGKSAVFKTGIAPVFPIDVHTLIVDPVFYPGQVNEVQLSFESRFAEGTEIQVTLPASGAVSFEPNTLSLHLPAGSRTSATVHTHVTKPGIAASSLPIRVTSGTETFTVHGELDAYFVSPSGIFYGETSSAWLAANGSTVLSLNKFDNRLSLRSAIEPSTPFEFNLPKLGPPFSDQFVERRPVDVRFVQQEEKVTLEADYMWQELSGILLTVVAELSPNGALQLSHRVLRTEEAAPATDLKLKLDLPISLTQAVLPYDDTFLDLSTGAGAIPLDYWKPERLSENWIFFRRLSSACGVVWHKGLKPVRSHRSYTFEQSIGPLAIGESDSTAPLRLFVDTFRDWQQLRAHALEQSALLPSQITEHLSASLNNGNPFLPEAFDLHIREHKDIYLSGEITLSAQRGSIQTKKFAPESTSEFHQITDTLKVTNPVESDMVTWNFDMDALSFERKQLVFPSSTLDSEKVSTRRIIDKELDVFEVSNGILTLRVAPSFGSALYSMQYQGKEWLDSSFPQAGPKSFWNPWLGGIGSVPEGLTLRALTEEQIFAEFDRLSDTAGNEWSGIRLTITIEQNKKFKGLTYHQYFLLRPGTPVMASVTRIEQQSGNPIPHAAMLTQAHIYSSEDPRDGKWQVHDSQGDKMIYKTGRYENSTTFEHVLRAFSNERTEKLLIVPGIETPLQQQLMVLNEVSFVNYKDQFDGRDGKTSFTRPYFYVFTDLEPEDQHLTDLRRIEFL
ncbi:GNAT family N-acetyltransferase [Saccharibacillus sp. JS10]|uniref:GNAT family N-acetyltransferase n=1 Tax=Saccharibacillus sp. JS10 TaxID=2950552 RepID=UPI00210B466A|nr:GNAT family N-acetyltransferase [Saccharibacillus sp. JS10]MCQ4085376.1 GNAT family N-acetyltransferase [Saccharibacillus sp. JS10]